MPKPSPSSLVLRAILALVLMVGFYGLAIVVVGVLLFIPYAEWTYAHRLHLRLAFFCLAGAGIILWSIVPRPDRFVPPGPRLEPDKHPRLFQELAHIAQAVRQAVPAEVYLMLDVNAAVSHRGGVMGLGSRPVMILGLPLLQVLTVSQFRAVLAHEFGHYHGGDVKLGPWVYKTRAAIFRTLEGLGQHSSLLQKPFEWYARLFLRVTHAVSRHQEFAADALAAQVAGSRSAISAMTAIQGAALAFGPFWNDEVAPVLNAGFRVPLMDGFAQFMSTPAISNSVSRVIDQAMSNSKPDPYDTHPSLRDRIEAIKSLPPGALLADDPLAISLLEDVSGQEKQLLASLVGQEAVAKLEKVDWDQVGAKVYVPQWKSLVREQVAALTGVVPEWLPQLAKEMPVFVRRLRIEVDLTPEQRHRLAIAVVGAALALAFNQQGWTLHAMPGVPISFWRDETVVEPFAVLPGLLSGELTADAWVQQCREAGIARVDLGTMAG